MHHDSIIPILETIPQLPLGVCEIPLTDGRVTLVDAADYEWLSQWKWHLLSSGKGYAARWTPGSAKCRRIVYMHRLILGAESDQLVDHIDGNGLNNRRVNLRQCTRSQNGQNQQRRIANTSGYKGVSRYERDGMWRAAIRTNGHYVHLGCFSTAEQAGAAYDNAALRLFGEFAQING